MAISKTYKQNLKDQKKFTDEELRRLDQIEQDAIAKFKGQLPELESALGMLRHGQQLGWKVIHLIHSKATVRKYEAILNIKVREEFPETTKCSERNNGFKLVQKVTNFWKAASGEKDKLPGKHIIE